MAATGSGPGDADACEVTIDALSDELLGEVLKRLLPRPGLFLTRAVLVERHAIQTLRRNGNFYAPATPDRERAATEIWRESLTLARRALPDVIYNTPIWCTSREAENFYSSPAAGLPYLLVCKAWCVYFSTQVKTAVCGLHERPPSSTEVLFVAWDWGASANEAQGQADEAPGRTLLLWPQSTPLHSDQAHAGQLNYLSALPRLHTLILCNTNQDTQSPKSTRNKPTPLPPDLPSLRHLIVAAAPHPSLASYGNANGQFVASIAPFKKLLTLALPEGFTPPRWTETFKDARVSAIVQGMPHLEVLVSDDAGVDDVVARLTSLRVLRAAYATHTQAYLLSDLTALEKLALLHSDWYSTLAESLFPQIRALPRLADLDLGCVDSAHCGQGALAKLAHAPALRALRVQIELEHSNKPIPLASLAQLTRLSLAFLPPGQRSSDVALTDVHLQELGCLTALRDLSMQFVGDQSWRALTGLGKLTSLTIRHSSMSARACRDIASLTQLQALYLGDCNYQDDRALAELQRLHALRELVVQCRDGFSASVATQLQPTASFPRLVLLELGQSLVGALGSATNVLAKTDHQILPNVARLRDVEELRLVRAHVTNDMLRRIALMPELRRLVLRRSQGWDEAGIWHLTVCKKLLYVDVHGTGFRVSAELRQALPFSLLYD